MQEILVTVGGPPIHQAFQPLDAVFKFFPFFRGPVSNRTARGRPAIARKVLHAFQKRGGRAALLIEQKECRKLFVIRAAGSIGDIGDVLAVGTPCDLTCEVASTPGVVRGTVGGVSDLHPRLSIVRPWNESTDGGGNRPTVR